MRSIHSRLALSLFLGFLVLLSVAATAMFFVGEKLLEKDFDSRLFAKAQAALASISQKGSDLDVDWNELPHRQKQLGEKDTVQITDSSGNPLETDDSHFPSLYKLARTNGYHDILVSTHGPYRVLFLPFVPRVEEEDEAVTPARLLKPCILLVGTSRHDLDHSLRKFAVILAATAVITLLVSLIMVYTTVSVGLRPLDRFSTFVGSLGIGSLGQRVSSDHLPIELEPIAQRLNNFLEHLDLSFTRERQFSADVSHELRTPVAELRTLAEVTLRRTGSIDPESKQGFQEVLEISKRMGALIGVLLEIVRQERNTDGIIFSETDPWPILEKQWRDLQSKAEGRHLELAHEIRERELTIMTEPSLLAVILGNLLENAVEYAVPSSSIDARVHPLAGATCLTISNETSDLIPADLAHIFDRFWRKDQARGTSSHFGIGLAITMTLCQRLGIELSASMPAHDRVQFQLKFPIRQPVD